jgi:hypothetical protein
MIIYEQMCSPILFVLVNIRRCMRHGVEIHGAWVGLHADSWFQGRSGRKQGAAGHDIIGGTIVV